MTDEKYYAPGTRCAGVSWKLGRHFRMFIHGNGNSRIYDIGEASAAAEEIAKKQFPEMEISVIPFDVPEPGLTMPNGELHAAGRRSEAIHFERGRCYEVFVRDDKTVKIYDGGPIVDGGEAALTGQQVATTPPFEVPAGCQ